MIPKDVAIVARRPMAGAKKQVVVRADDAAGMIVVDAYLEPGGAPVLTEKWELPKP